MVNKNPNKIGLIQHNKVRKIAKAKRIANEKQSKVNKIREDKDKFVDTYLIQLALEEPNDVKVAAVLTKWQLNNKNDKPKEVIVKKLDLSGLRKDVTLTD